MNKASLSWVMVIGLGLLLVVVLFISIFIASMVFGVDESQPPPPLGFCLVAAIMVAATYFSGRLMKPTSRKQEMTYDLIWAFMAFLIILGIAAPNGTVGTFFGNWGVYLVFVGMALGPMLIKINKIEENQ